jgi:hypothetical protein
MTDWRCNKCEKRCRVECSCDEEPANCLYEVYYNDDAEWVRDDL